MMWIITIWISSFLAGLFFGRFVGKYEVLEDRFDMTGFKEKEHLVSIAPYEGTR